MEEDADYLRMAIEEAFDGIRRGHGGPFGCVIVKDGKVLARSHNHVLLEKDPTSHGEIHTIREACRVLDTIDLSGCTLYTSSEPCPMCKAAICWAKVSRVVYAASVEEASSVLGFKDLRMTRAIEAGEELTPSDHVPLDDRLGPFLEYRDMQGKIY